MLNSNHEKATWDESRLWVFANLETTLRVLEEIKSSMHNEFKSLKDDFTRDYDLRFEEMREEIKLLKQNQFELQQRAKVDDGKGQGKAIVYAVIAIVISIIGAVSDFLK